MKIYNFHVSKVQKVRKIIFLGLLFSGFAESVVHANNDDIITKSIIIVGVAVTVGAGLGYGAYCYYEKPVQQFSDLEKQEETQEALHNRSGWHNEQNGSTASDVNGVYVAQEEIKKELPHQKTRRILEQQRKIIEQQDKRNRQEKMLQNIVKEELNYVGCGSL